MLKIRLKRVGRKHEPSFRIIVTEKHLGPKSGKYIENVGFYNALHGQRRIDGERVKYWISKGAGVSPTVRNFLITEGIIEGKKINVLPKKKPIVKKESGEVKSSVSAPAQTTTTTADVVVNEPIIEEATQEAVVEDVEEQAPTEKAPVVEETVDGEPTPIESEETPAKESKTE